MENNLLNRPYLLTLLMVGLIAIIAIFLPIIHGLVEGSPSGNSYVIERVEDTGGSTDQSK
ncbi:hypothetical protein LQZ19_09585 [Treponema primitia]|uniref:hypothetical protein n=1 Tax=Treponema primitia TaxID=88058 RepID=UPI00398096CD